MLRDPEIEMTPAFEPTYFFRTDEGGELLRSLAVALPHGCYAVETSIRISVTGASSPTTAPVLPPAYRSHRRASVLVARS